MRFKKVLLILFLLLGAAIAIAIYYNWGTFKLERQLKDVSIERLEVDGKVYSIKNGKVLPEGNIKALRLSAFYIWIKEDPLFTAPNFGLAELKTSLSLLDREQKELLSLHQAKEGVSIFPTEFLSSLPEINEKHKNFLEKPTTEGALALLSSYEAAQSHYENHISRKTELLTDLLKDKNKETNVVYLGISTTPQILLDDHRLILENAKALKREIMARKKCLTDGVGCVRPSLHFSLRKQEVPKLSKEQFLEDDVIFHRYIIKGIEYRIQGPFASPTPCFGLNDDLSVPHRIFYLVTSKRDTLPDKPEVLNIELATEEYYQRLLEERFEDRLFIKKGFKWRVGFETNEYDCPNNKYMPSLATLASFTEEIKSEPLLSVPETGIQKIDSLLKEGRQLEKELAQAEIPTLEHMQNLSSLYLKLYAELGAIRELQGKREELLERGLAGQKLLTGFDQIIERLAYTYSVLKMNEFLNQPLTYNPLFLYFIRGAHSLVYFPFSPSFWRIDKNPTYIQARLVKTTGFDNRFLTYREALTRYPKEEILRWSSINPASEIYPIYLKKQQKDN